MTHAIFSLCFALQNVSGEAAQHMQAGVEAHRQGHEDAAIVEFRKATEIDPSLAQGFLNLGDEYMLTHDYGSAIPPLKRALELSPDLEEAHLRLGYALLSLGFAAEAIPHLERVHALEALGIAQIETGQFQEAIGNLSLALAQHPDQEDLLYYLGRAAGLLSKRSIDTLVEYHPNSARTHQAMAENYYVLRQMPQAETEFREALKERSDIPSLHLELGLVYAGSGQWPKAEEEFRAESKLRPGNAEAHYRLGSALLQQGKLHEARQELERANQLRPDMPEVLYSLGKAASLDGDPGLAEKTWLRQIQIEKQSGLAAQAHFGLATLYRKEGKPAKAQNEMQEFQRLQKTSPPPDDRPK